MMFSRLSLPLAFAIALITVPAWSHQGQDELRSGIDAAASLSLRSEGYVDSADFWHIPGIMMGGEATPIERGAVLDDAFISGAYALHENTYVLAKVATHGGEHSELELEHLWFEQRYQAWQFAAGKMAGSFSPMGNWHASLSDFSEAPLLADAFFGRYFTDTGVKVAWASEHWQVGTEWFNGDSFPATSGQGLADVFANYRFNNDNWRFSTGLWAMLAKAELRGDERYLGAHSHGNSGATPSPLDARFSGDSYLTGWHVNLAYVMNSAWQAKFYSEWMWQQNEGDMVVIDNGRNGELEGDYSGWLIEPALVYEQHQFSLRFERLALENNISAASPSFIAADSKLLNDGHEPQRLSFSWMWQFNPLLKLRSEYVRDDVLAEGRERFMLGLVWQQNLWRR